MNNDDKILKLKSQIENKKAKLLKLSTFRPTTNCMLIFNDVKYNLHVLNKEKAIILACQLQSIKRSSEELDLKIDNLSGYSIDDWLVDITGRIAELSIKEEKAKLKSMENRLTELLSNDKKIELEIEEIEKEL